MRALIVSLLFSTQLNAAPAYYTDKVNDIPNICQSCFPKIIKWGGKPHCAPAAVANSLHWLAKNGYPALQPYQSDDALVNEARLVELLGITMDTTESTGTSPKKVLAGLRKYLVEKNVSYNRLAATGWRSVPDFVVIDNMQTKLDWIKEGTLEKKSVWLLIGWSQFDPRKENYEIYDGHWMTVVGYGKNRKGEIDPNIIIVHDPAERAERKNYFATVSELKHGTINKKISAKNVLHISGDIVLKPGADFGIIQGAYRLEL